MKKSGFTIYLALKGMAMGIAEAIPGVSGGTIAFITGIYERLIGAIGSFDGSLLKLLQKGQFKEAWEKVDGLFLVNLFAGMIVGLVFAVFVISHFITHYPTILWGFFFGLIASSSIWLLSQYNLKNAISWLILLIGISIAFFIVQASPAEGSLNPLYVFISGMVAICALVLPGISGSFILLLLGMYKLVIGTVKSFLSNPNGKEFFILFVFAIGCIVGLLAFVRILKWAFNKYENNLVILLCGFMLGSLWKIWPWRNPNSWLDENYNFKTVLPSEITGEWLDEIRVLSESNVLPGEYLVGSPYTIESIAAIAIGAAVIWFFPKLSKA